MRHKFMALTNPVPGREDDFNAWYDGHHLQEVIDYGTGMAGGEDTGSARYRGPGRSPPPGPTSLTTIWSTMIWRSTTASHGSQAPA